MEIPANKNPIAYFCAEFGIDSNLPTYAGGLGILAGDTLLEAAQQDFPMIGIGLLYQGRYFLQEFSPDGWQIERPSPFNPENTQLVRPVEVEGKKLKINLNFFDQKITIVSYQQKLGTNTYLYLLTSDFDQNPDSWRDIMSAEYCCGDEAQLMQQLVLGIGGMRLLEALKITPKALHFQEGRPIFAHWELLKNKLTVPIIYTNHTLVPDGNLVYSIDLVKKYAESYSLESNIPVDTLLGPGVIDDKGFSITKYGLNVASKVSAVSKFHCKLCKKNWPSYKWTYVTDGIHLPRWQSQRLANPNLSDCDLWDIHLSKKRDLARLVQKRSGFSYDPERLILGWARRITGYKQVEKIFADSDRLAKILCNQDKPVQILIAGKAHPGDNLGKKCIQDVMKIMTEKLSDRALFIPNYDIALAAELVAGVDVWLNTPEVGKEACGTSGMKALSNGVLNCTVADGWAAEVNWKDCGWELNSKNISDNLCTLLEKEIVPMYFDREKDGIPSNWIKHMRASISISQNYSTKRMLEEYKQKLYSIF